jgi:hypothetical protein
MDRPARNAMRSIALNSLLFAAPVLAAMSGCMKTLPPDDPSNQEGNPTEDAEAPPPEPPTLSGGDPMVPVTVKDEGEGEKKALSCGGASIADLSAVLAQPACEVKDAKPDEPQKELKDLEITVAADSAKVAPGTSAKVTITYHNKGKVVLPLDFMVDPEPRFDFEVYTVKGARADNPKGDSPTLPPEVQDAPEPEKTVARVTLAPNGTAKVSASWNAVKFKWASKDKAKGAIPGRGYPREPAAPLPKGKYVLRVITPLVGVAEGSDHELTQPRTPIEIGERIP